MTDGLLSAIGVLDRVFGFKDFRGDGEHAKLGGSTSQTFMSLRPSAIPPYELDLLQCLRRALTFQKIIRQGKGYQRERVCCPNQKEAT
jgi:hypothetical protein